MAVLPDLLCIAIRGVVLVSKTLDNTSFEVAVDVWLLM
jgi:hypothetical protein